MRLTGWFRRSAAAAAFAAPVLAVWALAVWALPVWALGGAAVEGAAAPSCAGAPPAATLVYLGAWDCPYCTKWKADERPKFARSAAAGRIALRELDTARLRRPDFEFPPDLAWLAAKYRNKKGVPRFLVVRGETVLLDAYGLSGWREKTLPMLKELAGKPC